MLVGGRVSTQRVHTGVQGFMCAMLKFPCSVSAAHLGSEKKEDKFLSKTNSSHRVSGSKIMLEGSWTGFLGKYVETTGPWPLLKPFEHAPRCGWPQIQLGQTKPSECWDKPPTNLLHLSTNHSTEYIYHLTDPKPANTKLAIRQHESNSKPTTFPPAPTAARKESSPKQH